MSNPPTEASDRFSTFQDVEHVEAREIEPGWQVHVTVDDRGAKRWKVVDEAQDERDPWTGFPLRHLLFTDGDMALCDADAPAKVRKPDTAGAAA
jgi:DMSO/TMAO reductase YedYZ molybdopterin-dependent catalytic subunit